MKKALVLCGGLPQIPLIEDLKKRGIETILLDMNDKVIARKYADKFYKVSVLDVDAVRQVAIDEKVDYILTVCADQVLMVVAQLCEELGLPWYIDYETAKKVSNKTDMKEIFYNNQIPTSKYRILDEYSENTSSGMEFPLVVKPVDAYSSKGVNKVYNEKELEVAVSEAVNVSRSKTAIVEEFVQGKELSVDVYVEHGKSHILCISQLDKIPGESKFVINRCVFPAQISEKERLMVEDACQKVATAFSLENSPMLVQLVTNGDSISILEFCARTGGGNKFRLIKNATGFDVVTAVTDLTLGLYPHIDENIKQSKIIIDEFLYCHPGIFDHLEGFDELVRDGVISEYYLLKESGTEMKKANSSGDRIAYFTIEAESYESIKEKHLLVNTKISVIDKNGNDILRHGLLETID